MNATASIVSKVWSFCTTLRDDGVSYGDYLEQLTYLIFLKMADEYSQPPYSRKVGIPAEYNWPSLKAKRGAELEVHYVTLLRELGNKPGMLGSIFTKAQNKIQDPAKLYRLIDKVYANSALGSGKDTAEQVKIGALEMARVSTSEFHGIVPESVVPSFPFLFRNVEHFRSAMYGAPGDDILAAFDKYGYIGLCMYEGGTRSMYSKKPIRSVADMKGMKVRVQPSDLWVAVISAMGATATPIPFSEVYTALKVGLVDAAENSYPSYETMKHYESAGIYSETEHVMAPDIVVFSKKIWLTLSKEEQEIIRKAAKESVPYFSKLWIEKEQAAKKAAISGGAKIIDAKDIDHKSFVDAVKPVWDKFAATPEQKSLVQKIINTK